MCVLQFQAISCVVLNKALEKNGYPNFVIHFKSFMFVFHIDTMISDDLYICMSDVARQEVLDR